MPDRGDVDARDGIEVALAVRHPSKKRRRPEPSRAAAWTIRPSGRGRRSAAETPPRSSEPGQSDREEVVGMSHGRSHIGDELPSKGTAVAAYSLATRTRSSISTHSDDRVLAACTRAVGDRGNSRERPEAVAVVDERLGAFRQRRARGRPVAFLKGRHQGRATGRAQTHRGSSSSRMRLRFACRRASCSSMARNSASTASMVIAGQPPPRSLEPGFLGN